MPAASLHRRFLIVTAFAAYALVFMSLVVFEVPGLGLGHFFYIPVALLALAGGTRLGLLGGGMATALYTIAIVVTPRLPTRDVLTAATVIRLVTYSSCGALVGWFANEHRRHLEQLRELAERDFLTGILNTRMFDEALARRCSAARPFLLLLGDMDNLKQGMVSIYLRYIHDGVEVPVTGALTRYRDFVFVHDVIDALQLALGEPATDNETFNVGTGRRTTVRELIDIVAAQYGHGPGTYPVREVGAHAGDVAGSVASIAKLASLGWGPRYGLAAGVGEMVGWLKRARPST